MMRTTIWRLPLITFSLAVALAGCWSSSAPPPVDEPDPEPPFLITDPPVLEGTNYEGESGPIFFSMTTESDSGSLDIALADSAGRFSELFVQRVDNLHFDARVNVSPALPPGTYTGDLEIRLCHDAATECRRPREGSPWLLPYTLHVLPATNMTPLKRLQGASAWTTFQGDAAHSGRVPATVNPAQFTRRWVLDTSVPAVAVESGRVHFSGQGKTTTISEDTGEVLWTYDAGIVYSGYPPAVLNGKVFVSTSPQVFDGTFVRTLDASTGQLLASRSTTPGGDLEFNFYLAPTPYQTRVFLPLEDGSLLNLDAASLALEWSSMVSGRALWAPAIDATGVYAQVGRDFVALDGDTGARLWTLVDDGYANWDTAMRGTAVLDGQGSAYAVHHSPFERVEGKSRLVSASLADRAWRWRVADHFSSNPIVAGSAVYVVNGQAVDARSAETGALLWSWTSPEAFPRSLDAESSIVLVGTVLFVATIGHTYAIDVNTRAMVWSYPASGRLAVSDNGILYIAGRRLVAINLH